MTGNKKKKVLFFLPSGVGGAEKMTVNIAKMLDTSQYEVKFVLVDRTVRDITKFIPKGYDINFIKIHNIWDFTTFKLIKKMRQERPDIVFCSLKYLNPRVIIAAHMIGGIKTIVRNDAYMNLIKGVSRSMLKFSYPKADIVIAQTEQMRKEIMQMLPVDPAKVITLHNPVDQTLIDSKLVNTEDPFTVVGKKYVATSRINSFKGQDTLIKAFAKVQKSLPESHLFLVGRFKEEDPYYKELLVLAEKNGIKNKVHFPGFTSNPYLWLKYADCFVLASRREGLPNTLIEASYIGVPLVATRCLEIITEIVEDGYNGYTVAMDDVDGMAEAMIKAVNLKNFTMTYKQATKKQFVELFEK